MIRAATEQDLPAMLEIYGPYIRETAYSFEYEVPDLEEWTNRFLSVTAEFPWLVWEEYGEVLGYCYASRAFARAAYGWDADLSIYLRQDCRGRGVGRKLYEAVENLLRCQGYLVAYGVVTSDNAASCAFHRAMGYQAVAELPDCGWKFGRWHGVTWFEKRLSQGTPQGPVISWKECKP